MHLVYGTLTNIEPVWKWTRQKTKRRNTNQIDRESLFRAPNYYVSRDV